TSANSRYALGPDFSPVGWIWRVARRGSRETVNPQGLLRDHAARGTVTETVVPGDAAAVVTRPPSCRVSASTMLVPRPILTGASGKRVLIPRPSSETESRQALAVDSKPTTMLPLAPRGNACFSAFIVSSVAIRPM